MARVAVVTPYYKEADRVLRDCMNSVKAQTHRDCRHIMVADGFPNPLVSESDVDHIILPRAHGDAGNLARAVGSLSAVSQKFDAVALLDADNWYQSDHIEELVALHRRTGAAICTSGRTFHRLDGSLMKLRHPAVEDGEGHVDTSCMCFFSASFDLLPLWGLMPKEFGPICDRVVWRAVRARGVSRAHSPKPTVAFRTQYAVHYRALGEVPPPNAKDGNEGTSVMKRFLGMELAEQIALLQGWGIADASSPSADPADTSPHPEREVQITAASGKRKLTLRVPEGSGIDYVVDEIFSRQCYKPLEGMEAPKTILDIGANVGLASAFFRLAYPDAFIHGVEPDSRAFHFLERNGRVIGNCRFHHVGLYNVTCPVIFHSDANSVLSSVSGSASGSSRPIRTLVVDPKTFVESLSGTSFELVKLDAEGSEIAILLGLRGILPAAKLLHIEFHSHSDRRVIDTILSETHVLWAATVNAPHRGQLTYVAKQSAPVSSRYPEIT